MIPPDQTSKGSSVEDSSNLDDSTSCKCDYACWVYGWFLGRRYTQLAPNLVLENVFTVSCIHVECLVVGYS